ncbi:MAG TPA: hypothetical protein VEZ71_15785 [Archangium sp.]|nr:hypothetical protein [Archangium sp.]
MKLRVFDVHAQATEARQYLAGQHQALAAHGVTVGAHESWLDAPPGVVSLVTAHDSVGELVGGVRIHLRNPWGRLPMEEYLGDSSLNALLRERAKETPAQLTGLWLHSAHRGTGLSDFLFLAGVAACRALGAGFVCGCAPAQLLPIYRKYGGHYDASRTYAYPDERYVTYVTYVDLSWCEAPDHPARAEYLGMRAAFQQGQDWLFTPARALAWNPPLVDTLPGPLPVLATG